MARRWVPKATDPVHPRAPIGRRLFAVPQLAGAADQRKLWKDTLEINHFLEKRAPGDISLDRLGEHNVDANVREYLLPRARDAGYKFLPPKDFDGWACLRAGVLEAPPKQGVSGYALVASPVAAANPDDLACNPYHYHVCRKPQDNAYTTAVMLRQLFHDYGDIEWVTRQRWWQKYWEWAIGAFRGAMRRLGG